MLPTETLPIQEYVEKCFLGGNGPVQISNIRN